MATPAAGPVAFPAAEAAVPVVEAGGWGRPGGGASGAIETVGPAAVETAEAVGQAGFRRSGRRRSRRPSRGPRRRRGLAAG